jgi:hypothetical protein
MLKASGEKDPVVLSYLALRRAVGYVALGLPFALAITWWVVGDPHLLQDSISAYYHTGVRNLFVGSLCAIAMFQFCCRGYDLRDEIAGIFSSFCALGVAFFPTTPTYATKHQSQIGAVHYTFAALLFLTLAYFCLVLFRETADPATMTEKKRQRNRVYTVCGYAIMASILLILASKIPIVQRRIDNFEPVFWFETTALIAFGIAWLIKGGTFLRDERPHPTTTKTTDNTVPTAPDDASEGTLSIKDKIAIVASVIALCLSLFSFFKDSVLNQHVLRASVVGIEEQDTKIRASILLVNAGKHYETLYRARFIYSNDLSTGGGSMSKESVGPVALKPGEATVLTLEAPGPDIRQLRENGTVSNSSGIHLGVAFNVVTPSGKLLDDDKIYRCTEMLFDGDKPTGNKPRPGDTDGLIDLL